MALVTFPTLAGVAFPVIKTPTWDTDVQLAISGKRTTLGRYIYPLYNWTLNYDSAQGGFLRSSIAHADYQSLWAFFNSVGARRDMWLFNDPYDNTATAQQFGVGDGVTVAFQLTRTITGGSFSWADPIFFPTIANIFDNGGAPGAYSVSNTGLVTFTSAPTAAHILTWTGTYKWPCFFEQDTAIFEQFMFNLFEIKKISFVSAKL
jgi:uncharacterized protein (TIGR02217 family)